MGKELPRQGGLSCANEGVDRARGERDHRWHRKFAELLSLDSICPQQQSDILGQLIWEQCG